MEISISDIISIIGLLLSGGSIGGFFTWRYARRKEQAEAVESEASAAKEVQDVYQQLITDVKTDRDEQKAYIQELKDDRRHLRSEREELRSRQDKLEQTVRDLQFEVARNTRMVTFMRPWLCGREGCAIRVPVNISAAGEIEKSEVPAPVHDIEPVEGSDM